MSEKNLSHLSEHAQFSVDQPEDVTQTAERRTTKPSRLKLEHLEGIDLAFDKDREDTKAFSELREQLNEYVTEITRRPFQKNSWTGDQKYFVRRYDAKYERAVQKKYYTDRTVSFPSVDDLNEYVELSALGSGNLPPDDVKKISSFASTYKEFLYLHHDRIKTSIINQLNIARKVKQYCEHEDVQELVGLYGYEQLVFAPPVAGVISKKNSERLLFYENLALDPISAKDHKIPKELAANLSLVFNRQGVTPFDLSDFQFMYSEKTKTLYLIDSEYYSEYRGDQRQVKPFEKKN